MALGAVGGKGTGSKVDAPSSKSSGAEVQQVTKEFGEGKVSTENNLTVSSDNNPNVKWVDENASMSDRARNYDDSATGSRSNVETQTGQAPSIQRTLEDGSTRPVKFDGFNDDVLIDRKISVVTTPKAKNQVLRQSQALSENGLTGRWEVPTEAQARRAQKMFDELGVKNIEVRVVTEP